MLRPALLGTSALVLTLALTALAACNNNSSSTDSESDTPQWITPAETTAPTPMGDDDSAQ